MKDLHKFLELVSNVMGAYSTVLFTAGDNDNKLKITSFYSLSKNINAGCTISSGDGLAGWVYREQKPVLASNFERNTKTLLFYKKDENIKSFMAVPLPERKGVLCVDSKRSYSFTEEKEKIFHQMAYTACSIYSLKKAMDEKNELVNLLTLSLNMDELLCSLAQGEQTAGKMDLLKKTLGLLVGKMDLSAAFFVVPDLIVFSCRPGSQKGSFIYKEYERNFFSDSGLIAWVIKNNKVLVREKILQRKNKLFLLNKEEKFEPFSRFLGFPLTLSATPMIGGLCLISKKNKAWEKIEISVLQNLGHRFFFRWFHAGT